MRPSGWLSKYIMRRAGVPTLTIVVDFTISEARVTIDESTIGSQIRVEGPEKIPEAPRFANEFPRSLLVPLKRWHYSESDLTVPVTETRSLKLWSGTC